MGLMSKRHVPRHGRKVVIDSSDENQIKMAVDNERDRDQDLAFIMAQPRGRRYLYELIHERCHVDRISHVPNDPHSSAYNDGARSVGQALLDEIRSKHHALYIKMLEENDVRDE